MIYFLMHKNTKLAAFEVDGYNISEPVINKDIFNVEKLLPFVVNNSSSKRNNLNHWLHNRSIPATRKGIVQELRQMHKESSFEYLIDNLALSLTDHYWICPKDSKYTWENVNLYTNDFQSSLSLDLSSDINTIAGKTNFVPSASLKGDLKKKWIIGKDGNRYLVKGNYNNTCRQSLCEVLATEIHKRQNRFEYTPYRTIEISSNNQKIVGCFCPNFTSTETEFIPAIDIIEREKKKSSTNYFEMYIDICGKNGISQKFIREFMEYQILTDFIITNTDRHFNNFGVIRDSNTLKFIKPAPIFDSGNSMFYNCGRIKTDRGLLNIPVTSFQKFEVKLLQYVKNPKLVNLDLLPTPDEVAALFEKDKNSEIGTPIKLAKAYSKKIDFLRQFQDGKRIFSYNYLHEHNVKLKVDS